MVKLIRTFHKRKLVEAFAHSESTCNILEWGTTFSSYYAHSYLESSPIDYVIIHFKHYFVHFNSYDTLASAGRIFPIRWVLSVSNDNSTWEAISESNDPVCSESNKYKVPNDNKYLCNNNDKKHYLTNQTGYASFVKFKLIENSYYNSDGWKHAIVISGIEFNGYYVADKPFTCFIKHEKYFLSLLFATTVMYY